MFLARASNYTERLGSLHGIYARTNGRRVVDCSLLPSRALLQLYV